MEKPHYILALSATAHCVTGCAIGEILGMSLGAYLAWPNIETIIISTVLAFFFGYSLTLIPLLKSAIGFAAALKIALTTDTMSIAVMEFVDNFILYFIPGALDAPVNSLFFWVSLLLSLLIAFIAAFPVNLFLVKKGIRHSHHH